MEPYIDWGGMKIERELMSSSVLPQWIELPYDIMSNILGRLDAEERLEIAEKVCTTWRRICSDPVMWRDFIMDIHISDPENSNKEKKLWRRAVDRSQGQMMHLYIVNSCDNNLINYALDRSSGLKTLTLLDVEGFTGEDLVEAVKKLPDLEGLEVFYNPQLSAQDVINIGISCPNLKTFIYNPYRLFLRFGRGIPLSNEYALAIVESMPNLCHLCLISIPIDNEGLEAILDGCPNLEFLNLYDCNRLDLRGALGKRCSEQIKKLIFPSDNNKYGSCSDINQSFQDEDDDVPWLGPDETFEADD